MIIRSKSVAIATFAILSLLPTATFAQKFFIAAKSHITGFSTNDECEADGFGSGGCELFGSLKDCGGYSVYVGDFSYTQLLDEYRQGEKITVRHVQPDGAYGYVICTYN